MPPVLRRARDRNSRPPKVVSLQRPPPLDPVSRRSLPELDPEGAVGGKGEGHVLQKHGIGRARRQTTMFGGRRGRQVVDSDDVSAMAMRIEESISRENSLKTPDEAVHRVIDNPAEPRRSPVRLHHGGFRAAEAVKSVSLCVLAQQRNNSTKSAHTEH